MPTRSPTNVQESLPKVGSVFAQQPISGVARVEKCLVSGNAQIGGFTRMETDKKLT